MTGHRSWTADRVARLTDPDVARRAAEARSALEREEQGYWHTLTQLRRARQLTQTQLATALGVSQAQVSRVENQADLYLSTLRSYVQAMGGELELRAVFSDGVAASITIADLSNPTETEPRRSSGVPDVDLRTAFALLHRDLGHLDDTEEKFRAALAA